MYICCVSGGKWNQATLSAFDTFPEVLALAHCLCPGKLPPALCSPQSEVGAHTPGQKQSSEGPRYIPMCTSQRRPAPGVAGREAINTGPCACEGGHQGQDDQGPDVPCSPPSSAIGHSRGIPASRSNAALKGGSVAITSDTAQRQRTPCQVPPDESQRVSFGSAPWSALVDSDRRSRWRFTGEEVSRSAI